MRNKYLLEFIGSFLLVFFLGLNANPLAYGFLFIGLVYLARNYSGAYFNPAIVLALTIVRRMSINQMFKYMGVQILGAFLGIILMEWYHPNQFELEVNTNLDNLKIVVVQMVFAFLLASVYLYADEQKKKGEDLAFFLAVGGVVIGLGYLLQPITSTYVNPGIMIGAELNSLIQSNLFGGQWVSILGACAGAAIAAFIGDSPNKN